MERLECITCGTYVTPGAGATKLPCPLCGETIGRCVRCRELGKRYACKCGFEGP
jgi:predicted RNA-binding Zn-ribbon protein involved in translation (DUF1610 family)